MSPPSPLTTLILTLGLATAISTPARGQICLESPVSEGASGIGVRARIDPAFAELEGFHSLEGPGGVHVGPLLEGVRPGGERHASAARFAYEVNRRGGLTLCPILGIVHDRSPSGVASLRVPLALGVGAALGDPGSLGWGPYGSFGMVPKRSPTRLSLSEHPAPLVHPDLSARVGLMAWRGSVYAGAGYDILGGLRPSDLAVRLGLRF